MKIKKFLAMVKIAEMQRANNQQEESKCCKKTCSSSSSLSLNNGKDTDSQIVKNEDFKSLTKENSKEVLSNQKGTTYVIVGSDGCSRCHNFYNTSLGQVINNLKDKANFVELNYGTNTELYQQLKSEAGCSGAVGFPAIIKVVDGKAVEFMKYDDIANMYTDADKMTKYLGNKISSSTKTEKTEKNAAKENDCPDCAEKTDQGDKNKKSEQKVAKQKLETMKENLQAMNNLMEEVSTDSIKNAIENASSVAELKDAISSYSTGLDFNVQINLQSAVDALNEDADLDDAKEALLKML